MALEPFKLKWMWETDDRAVTSFATKTGIAFDCAVEFLEEVAVRDFARGAMPWRWQVNFMRPGGAPMVYSGKCQSVTDAQQYVALCVADTVGGEIPTSVNGPAKPSLVEPQPPPIDSEHPAVWPLVFHDMLARHAEGERKYGKPLRPHNGRDALTDAYQEALDLAVYLRQAIFERDGK